MKKAELDNIKDKIEQAVERAILKKGIHEIKMNVVTMHKNGNEVLVAMINGEVIVEIEVAGEETQEKKTFLTGMLGRFKSFHA